MKYPIIRKFIQRNRDLQDKIEEIYLFGSRARGEERKDSDYDLLLIVKENFSLSDKDHLYDRAMDILLDTGNLISLKIFKKKEFQRLLNLHTPFTQRVVRERVKVG